MASQKQINPWKEYELRKKELMKLNLSDHEFMEGINQILKELGL